MIKLYGGARLIKDFTLRRRDGRITVLPAGLVCAVVDIYTNPPGYELDIEYGEEDIHISLPPEYLEEA